MIETHERSTFENGIKIAYEHFEKIDDVIKVNRTRTHLRNSDHTKESFYIGKYNFYGCNNYEEAEKMAIKGWQKLISDEKFTGFYDLHGKEVEKLLKTKNDVVGFMPIIPNVLMGIPQCMINTTYKKVKSKIIHIVYNISVSAGVSSDELEEAGFEFMKAVIDLEKQGYRLKLTAMQDFSQGNDTDLMIVDVKSEYKKLDLYSSMFTLIHPAVFRAIGFVWKERSPIAEDMGIGYGKPFQNIHGELCMTDYLSKILKDENVLYISSRDIVDKKMKAIDIQKKIFEMSEKKERCKK